MENSFDLKAASLAASSLVVVAPATRAPRTIPLRGCRVEGEVAGPLVALTITRTYQGDPCAAHGPLAAMLRLPLPGNTAVQAVEVRFGEAEVAVDFLDMGAGWRRFEAALVTSAPTAVMGREAGGYTLRLAGMPAGEVVDVSVTYVQLAESDGRGWFWRLPFFPNPRGRSSTPCPIRLTFHGAGEVLGSGKATVKRQGDADVLDACLDETPNLTVFWSPPVSADAPTLHVWRHDDPTVDASTWLATVNPPKRPPVRPRRDLVVLTDAVSKTTRDAVGAALQSLGPDDRFSLGVLGAQSSWFEPGLRQARFDVTSRAIAWLDAMHVEVPVGWAASLREATMPTDINAVRQLLFVVGTEPADVSAFLTAAGQLAIVAAGWRLSVLAVGLAPESSWPYQAAAATGGRVRCLPADASISAIEDALEDWAEPLVPAIQLAPDGMPNQSFDLGDMPSGRCTWRLGRAFGVDSSPWRLLDQGGGELRIAVARPVSPFLGAAMRTAVSMSQGPGSEEPDPDSLCAS